MLKLGKFAGIFGLLFCATQIQAHEHHFHLNLNQPDPFLDELRLVDYGDGQARWMTRRELFQRSDFVHSNGHCGGYMDLTGQESVDSTALPEVSAFTMDLANRPLKQQVRVGQTLQHLDLNNFQKNIQELSAFRNRYYDSQFGVDSMNWIRGEYLKMAAGRADVTVELVQHNFKQPSVVATIQGKSLPNEIVVLGGHGDSINQNVIFDRANMEAPGADDNASGTATLMEVFRSLMATGYQPERTVKFMAYAGEEVGLLGSQAIANQFKREGKAVVAVLQLDMTSFAGSGVQISFTMDFVDLGLTRFTQRLVQEYVGIPYSEDKCGYPCSDHASWTKAGYPSVMPFEAKKSAMNKAIHTTRDKMDLLNAVLGMHFIRLGAAFAIELSAK